MQCPTCGEMFKVQAGEHSTRFYRKLDVALCPACSRGITPEVLVRFASPPREGQTPIREVLLACPYCGKIVGVASG